MDVGQSLILGFGLYFGFSAMRVTSVIMHAGFKGGVLKLSCVRTSNDSVKIYNLSHMPRMWFFVAVSLMSSTVCQL